jgi:hypothetical protein
MEVLDVDTGEMLKVYVFAACLPYSDELYTEGFYDMQEESWVEAHVQKSYTVCNVPASLNASVARIPYFTLFEEVGPMPRFTCAQPLSGVRDGVFAGAALIPEFVAGDAPSRGC